MSSIDQNAAFASTSGCVAHVPGPRPSRETARDVRIWVHRAILDGATQATLDLSDLAWASADVLSAILHARRILRDRGGDLRLVGANPKVARILDVTGLGGIIGGHGTPEDGRSAPPHPRASQLEAAGADGVPSLISSFRLRAFATRAAAGLVWVLPLLVLATLLLHPSRAGGYVAMSDAFPHTGIVRVHWPVDGAAEGIPYVVNEETFPFSIANVERVVTDSFGAWAAVPTSNVRFRDNGTVSSVPSGRDGRNTIYFDETGLLVGSPPASGVIAVTLIRWNATGEITDADIVLNGRDFLFSVSRTATPRGWIDLQDVLTHEIGHFIGLDHSPLEGDAAVRPTMNPFNDFLSPTSGRTLEADDEAGVSFLYPATTHAPTGSVSGNVVHPDGAGAWGAHVVAYRAGTRAFVVSSLSGLAGGDEGQIGSGAFSITGLPPGEYELAVEPVVSTITHQNFVGLIDRPFDRDFPVEWYANAPVQSGARLIAVSPGAVIEGLQIVLGFESTATRLPIVVGDFDGSGMVDFTDFILFAAAFGTRPANGDPAAAFDLDGDGLVGFGDFVAFASLFGEASGDRA